MRSESDPNGGTGAGVEHGGGLAGFGVEDLVLYERNEMAVSARGATALRPTVLVQLDENGVGAVSPAQIGGLTLGRRATSTECGGGAGELAGVGEWGEETGDGLAGVGERGGREDGGGGPGRRVAVEEGRGGGVGVGWGRPARLVQGSGVGEDGGVVKGGVLTPLRRRRRPLGLHPLEEAGRGAAGFGAVGQSKHGN